MDFAALLLGAFALAGPAGITANALDVYDLAGKSPTRRDVVADDPAGYWELRAGGKGIAVHEAPVSFGEGVTLRGARCDGEAFALELVVVKGAEGTLWRCSGDGPDLGLAVENGQFVLLHGSQRTPTGLGFMLPYEFVGLSTRPDGTLLVTESGFNSWVSPAPVARPARSSIVIGPGLVGIADRVVLFDHAMTPSRWLNRFLVTNAHVEPSPSLLDAPLELTVQSGHAFPVPMIALSPDDETLASVGEDKAVKLWDMRQRRALRTMTGHRADLSTVDWSPDGSRLVTGDEAGVVKVWDASRGTLLFSTQAHARKVVQATWSRDGVSFFTAGAQTLKLWDAHGKLMRTYTAGYLSRLASFSIHPSGRFVATLDARGLSCVWDVRSVDAEACEEPSAKHKVMRDVKWAKDRHSLAFPSADEVDVLLGSKGGGRVRLKGHTADVTTLDWSSAGSIASGDDKGGVLLWSPDLKLERVLTAADDTSVLDLIWHPVMPRLLVHRKINRRRERVEVWDTALGRRVADLGEVPRGSVARYSHDGRLLLVAGDGIQMWDAHSFAYSGAFRSTLKSPTIRWRGETMILSGDRAWDLKAGSVSPTTTTPNPKGIDPTGTFTLTDPDKDGGRRILDLDGGLIWEFNKPTRADAVRLSRDKRYLLVIDGDGLDVFDVKRRERLTRISLAATMVGGFRALVRFLEFQPGTSRFVLAHRAGLFAYNLPSTKPVFKEEWPGDYGNAKNRRLTQLAFSPDASRLAVREDQFGGRADQLLVIYDTRTWKVLRSIKEPEGALRRLVWHPDGKRLGTVTNDDRIIIHDTDTGAARTLEHPGGASDIRWSDTGAYFASSGPNRTVRVFLDEGWVTLLRDDDDQWVAVTHDGYFMASPEGGALLSASRGMNALSLDQIAPIANRPDIIAARLGAPAPTVRFYDALYRRRMARLSMSPRPRSGAGIARTAIPSASIAHVGGVDAKGVVELDLSFRSKEPLERYQIYINGVPTAAKGAPLRGQRQTLRRQVQLSAGTNLIEVEAFAAGAHSTRARVEIENKGQVPRELYYVGFGVSDYARDALDLDYAHRDVQDLGAAFSALSLKTHARTFTDAQVTPAALEEARRFLSTATENDVVFLFIAGHGLRDDDELRTYYYLGHDADPNELRETAIVFDDIEQLLFDTRARQKLFLIDTCESGEDLDLARSEVKIDGARGRSVRGIKRTSDNRGVTRVSDGRGLRRSSSVSELILRAIRERDRFILQDLSRRSGAIVIASSLGAEASLEAKKWANGAFTEEILKALSGDGDLDRDGALSVEELKTHLLRAVPVLTGGAQHPNVRNDNPQQKFVLPLPR